MKKILLTLLQLAVTAGALWFIFRNQEQRTNILNAFSRAEISWVLAAIVVSAVALITATMRWWLLLRVQGIHLGWKRTVQLYLIGGFFNLFLFGSTGGDALKMFYVVREVGPNKRANAILSVIMDRLLGLVALIILAAVFITLRYHWLTQTPASSALLASFGLILGGALTGLVLIFTVIGLRLVDRLPARLPGRAKFVEVAGACQTYARAWRSTLLGIVVSSIGHASFFFTFYFAARSVGAGVRLWDMSTIMPMVNTIVSLPISVAGVGLRETLFSRLLHDLCGTPEALAVPISIIGFLCSTIFYGLVGGVFFLFYRGPAEGQKAEVGTRNAEMAEG